MAVSSTVFEKKITVVPEHLDALAHVNNVVYVQFLQDIAGMHWDSLVNATLKDKVIWVVRKHTIEYMGQAFLDDELLIRTWTGENTAVSWNRHYEIIRLSDHKKIISASSVWVMLDKQTGRPAKIDAALLSLFS